MGRFQDVTAEAVEFQRNGVRSAPVKKVTSIVTQDLFGVEGGPVRILRLQGRITTVLQSDKNDLKITHLVSGGSAVDLCATANGNAAAAEKWYTVEGVQATALLISADEGVAVEGVDAGKAAFTLSPGTIAFNASSDTTGAIEFHCLYEPLVPGARVIAV